PDGEIERHVQISVRPDRVLLEYSLAMNAVTLRQQLERQGVSPEATLAKMWKQYEKVVLRSLPKKLRLSIDDHSIGFRPVRASYSGWSHRHLVCLFKADVALKRQRSEIVVTDGNFPQTLGNYRIAMKGRSGAQVENTTAALLVSKAEPISLAKLSEAERKAAAQAKGVIVLE
ncbi:MAG: hypothetical protein AAF745_14230, partial [Planctomycetota bacterium]